MSLFLLGIIGTLKSGKKARLTPDLNNETGALMMACREGQRRGAYPPDPALDPSEGARIWLW